MSLNNLNKQQRLYPISSIVHQSTGYREFNYNDWQHKPRQACSLKDTKTEHNGLANLKDISPHY